MSKGFVYIDYEEALTIYRKMIEASDGVLDVVGYVGGF